MDLRCSNLQMKLVTPREVVKATNSLQEALEIHDSPSSLVARLTKLKYYLKDAKKRYKVTYDLTFNEIFYLDISKTC